MEEIGWRVTRIRTFDSRPLYVPNATFASIALENPSRMQNRRIFETLGIRYEDATRMRNIVKDVKDMLTAHENIDQNRTLMVNFNKFAASSLDFFVYCFTKTVAWAEYHEIKQDVLLKTMDIIAPGRGAAGQRSRGWEGLTGRRRGAHKDRSVIARPDDRAGGGPERPG